MSLYRNIMKEFKIKARNADDNDEDLRAEFHEAYEEGEISGSDYDYLIRILDGDA